VPFIAEVVAEIIIASEYRPTYPYVEDTRKQFEADVAAVTAAFSPPLPPGRIQFREVAPAAAADGAAAAGDRSIVRFIITAAAEPDAATVYAAVVAAVADPFSAFGRTPTGAAADAATLQQRCQDGRAAVRSPAPLLVAR
jgi:hypothetical protein